MLMAWMVRSFRPLKMVASIQKNYPCALLAGIAMSLVMIAPSHAGLKGRQLTVAITNTAEQLGVGLFLLLLCALMEMAATKIIFVWIRSKTFLRYATRTSWHPVVVTLFPVLVLFLTSMLQVLMWALLYDLGGALETFDQAMYFSLVTYTSLGYGDVTVTGGWRLVAGCEALSGLLLVGWSTALLVLVLQRVAGHYDHRVD